MRSTATAPRGGSPGVFALEHRRLAQLLEKLTAAVAALPARPAPREVLRLLERETTFRHVLEHHAERERSILYPELDRGLPPAEREALVRDCLEEWAGRAEAA